MATPKPGEIRCPTCHRSTAPAAFCTQCGSPIPADARARPRGLDRDELQERVRLRRPTEEPYRRGGLPGAQATPRAAAYEAFTPEPEDIAAVRPADEPSVARVDRYREVAPPVEAPPPVEPTLRRGQLLPEEEEPLVAPLPPLSWDVAPPVREEAPPYVEPSYVERAEPEHVDYYNDAAYAGDDAYAHAHETDLETPRRSGAGVLAVVGLLVLGVAALFGGALLAGIFNGDRGGIGGLTPTASAGRSTGPTVTPTIAPSVGPTASAAGPSSTPQSSDGSVAFADGFEANAAPCQPGAADLKGCTASGQTNSGDVWIWVGFRRGDASDALAAAVTTAKGEPIAEGNIDLTRIGCRGNCTGWTYFPFKGLSPGKYVVRVTRNGEPAARTSFEVKG